MKKLLFTITLFSIFSCNELNKGETDQTAIAELRAYEVMESEEAATKKIHRGVCERCKFIGLAVKAAKLPSR